MFKYDVLCVGSATVDHFLTTDRKISSINLGDKVLADSMQVHTGGGATNSAAALARLGLKVRMLTKLGCDHDSEFITKQMKEYRVKNIAKHGSKKGTDFATIISSKKEKDRIIFVHKGASTDLCTSDIQKSKMRAEWFYLASLVGKSFKTEKEIAKIAKKKNVKVLFNPSLYLARKGKRYLKPILDATTVLVLNKKEAQALLPSSNFKKLLFGLRKLGPQTVVITQGPKKLYALHKNNIYHLLPPDVKVVHTAGAGDAFTSGLLAGMIRKFSFADALRLGQVNAASVVQHIGTKEKLLSMREAKIMMKKCEINIENAK